MWKYNQGNLTANRTNEDGSVESRFIVNIPPEELVDALSADPIVISVPTSCTMKQARLALFQSGLLDSVTSAIAAAGPEAKIIWEFSPTVDRHDVLVQQLSPILNLTNTKLDDLFTLANTL